MLRALGIVRRRKAVATLAFATVLAAIVSFALYLPDLYQAHATVVVERPMSETVVRQTVGGELESRLYVIKQEILSRDRLRQLIERFNLYPELRARASFDEVLDQARNDVDVEANGPEQVSGRSKTVTFTLTYTGDDRATVADVTNAIAQFYIDHNDQMRADEARRASAFLKEQLDAAAQELQTQEARLRRFASANQSLLPQAVGVNVATYARLNDDLRSIREQQYRYELERDRMVAAMEEARQLAAAAAPALALDGPEGFEPSKEFLDLTSRLNDAKRDLQEMQRTRGLVGNHPDVIAAQSLIETLELQTEAQREKDLARYKTAQAAARRAAEAANDPGRALPRSRRTIESLDADIKRLQEEEARIKAELAGLSMRFDGAPSVAQDYALVQQDHATANSKYEQALQRYNEARLAESVETGGQGERFRVLETALPPAGPSAPNRLRLMLLGFLLALGAAAAAVIAADKMDTSFHSVDELREFTAVPVLVTIPRIGRAPRRAYGRLVLGTASAVAAIVLVATLSAYIANGNETLVRMLQRAG